MQQISGATAADDPVALLLQAFPCGCLLLRDSLAASGQFLLPWLTAASLQQGHKVVFVAAAYSPAKHKAALRKIGAPGVSSVPGSAADSSSTSSSSIAFVSPAAAAAAAAAADTTQQQQQQQQQSMPRLQQLYQQVAAAAQQLIPQQQRQQQQQQQQLTVVVDSMTVLSSLVSDDIQVAAFVHHLTALGEVLQVPYRLILLAATDIPSDTPLLAAAAARAHIIADVSPLEGRTAALDGSLTVTVRQAAKTVAHIGVGLQEQGAASQQQQQQQGFVPGWLWPGSSSVWFFRAGDVGVRWLPQVHGKELMA